MKRQIKEARDRLGKALEDLLQYKMNVEKINNVKSGMQEVINLDEIEENMLRQR